MNISTNASSLQISDIPELNATTVGAFRDQIKTSLQAAHTQIDLDMSQTRFLDSSGLGALISIHKIMCGRKGVVRIINPTSQVQQILELTRMHRIFEIVRR
jgi:anti-sigma B factor antagonist